MIFNLGSSRNRTLNDLKRIIGKVKREDAAFKLEGMICKAVCDLNAEAIAWCGCESATSTPPIEQYGFRHCCEMLGINAPELHKTLRSAFDIVLTSEPIYNEDYEICNSETSRQDNEVQRRVCAKVVPFTRKRPKAY